MRQWLLWPGRPPQPSASRSERGPARCRGSGNCTLALTAWFLSFQFHAASNTVMRPRLGGANVNWVFIEDLSCCESVKSPIFWTSCPWLIKSMSSDKACRGYNMANQLFTALRPLFLIEIEVNLILGNFKGLIIILLSSIWLIMSLFLEKSIIWI